MKLIYLLALVVMTTVANVVSVEIPKCSTGHMMGRILDETDCTKYYQCIFAIPRLMTCPKISGKQTYFDQTLQLCLGSETSPCSNPKPGTSTITTPITSMTSLETMCKELIVPDPPIKPANCTPLFDCNTSVKDDCTAYYEWKGNLTFKQYCSTGFYFNSLLRQCDRTACPPCKATPPLF